MSNKYLRSGRPSSCSSGVLHGAALPQAAEAGAADRARPALPARILGEQQAGRPCVDQELGLVFYVHLRVLTCSACALCQAWEGQAQSTTAYRRALATHGVRVPQVSYEGLDRHCYGSAAATCAALSIRARARDATSSSRVRWWQGAHPGRRSGRRAVRTRLRQSCSRRTRFELRPARGCRCRPRHLC
jgi:hypothetical protein